jgi:hypothetical protein
MISLNEAQALRALLAREAPPPETQPAILSAGDVVQIRPEACATFGGMLLQIGQAEPHEIRGFLLRPHRGGCREAWARLHPCDVQPIGATWWKAPPFATRRDCDLPRCPSR